MEIINIRDDARLTWSDGAWTKVSRAIGFTIRIGRFGWFFGAQRFQTTLDGVVGRTEGQHGT